MVWITLRGCHLFIILLMLANISFAQQLTAIQLHNRQADEIIKIIEPLLKQNEGISGQGYEIFLNASTDTLRNVRELIAKIDKAPAQLLISVRSNNLAMEDNTDFRLNGSISGGNVRIVSGNTKQEDNISLNTSSRNSATSERRSPQIRVTEGQPALINTGSSIPIKITDRQRINGRLIERETVDYRPVYSGYYVTAWLNGDIVRLDLFYQGDSMQNQGAINLSRTNTSVQGKLGEWIAVSAISTTEKRNQNHTFSSSITKTNRLDDTMVYMKVEQIE